jgi:hypothetical protein
MVISLAGSKAASGAGSTVMILDAVISRPHSSVKAQLSVKLPPHSSYDPSSVPVTVPAIRQAPASPLE